MAVQLACQQGGVAQWCSGSRSLPASCGAEVADGLSSGHRVAGTPQAAFPAPWCIHGDFVDALNCFVCVYFQMTLPDKACSIMLCTGLTACSSSALSSRHGASFRRAVWRYAHSRGFHPGAEQPSSCLSLVTRACCMAVGSATTADVIMQLKGTHHRR